MSYASEATKVGRKPFSVVELELDFCSLTFGVGPCPAVGAGDAKCYNTRTTCQAAALAAYDAQYPNSRTYAFHDPVAGKFVGYNGPVVMVPALERVEFTPGKLADGHGLGTRGAVSITLNDFPHHDRGVDPYVSGRTYNPATQGTFFGKLLARNQLFNGRPLRVLTGFIGTSGGVGNFKTRNFIIETVDGPDSNGKVKIVAKDILKLADDDRAQCPAVTQGRLARELDAVTSGSVSGLFDVDYDIAAYPTGAGVIRINDEILSYSSLNASNGNVVGLTRGLYGTTAQAHEEADSIQLCVAFDNVRVVDVVEQIMGYSTITTAQLDAANWDSEKWLDSYLITAVLHEPLGVRQLINELAEQCLFDMWFDDENEVVKLRALAPPLPTATVVTLTDEGHLIAGRLKLTTEPGKRLSQVWVYYDQKSATSEGGAEAYRKVYAYVDLDSEEPTQYGQTRAKVFKSRWLDAGNGGAVLTLATRLGQRFAKAPLRINFSLDAKDHTLAKGDHCYINSKSIQGSNGANALTLFQIVSVREAEAGTRYDYEAVNLSFSGNYAYIAPGAYVGDPATQAIYALATDNEKNLYGFIGPQTGNFADGRTVYKVI